MLGGSLPALFKLARSLDVACQRYATLSCATSRVENTRRKLWSSVRFDRSCSSRGFPDMEIQRYASLALAALALGDHATNKERIVEEGAVRPLVDMCRFPEARMQLCAALALNAIALGPQKITKMAISREQGLEPLLNLLKSHDEECVFAGTYILGSLAEDAEVQAQLVDLGSIPALVAVVGDANLEIKRAAAYYFARLAESVECHAKLAKDGALAKIIQIASLEDVECQEVSAFALAHLASDRDLQVPLVTLGALKPLVAMMSIQAEPRHYAGLALLKLADNFENHVAIAQEGGIQALLRLGRERTTDEELQYKAALTVGTLASNAVKMMPPTAETHGTAAKRMVRSEIGFGAAAMLQGRVAGERAERGAYLEEYATGRRVGRGEEGGYRTRTARRIKNGFFTSTLIDRALIGLSSRRRRDDVVIGPWTGSSQSPSRRRAGVGVVPPEATSVSAGLGHRRDGSCINGGDWTFRSTFIRRAWSARAVAWLNGTIRLYDIDLNALSA